MGCFQGFCFSFIVCGVLAGSEANFVYFASLVLDIDSCHSIPNCILSRAISVHMSSGLFRVVGLKAFLSKGLSLRATLGVFLTNTRDGTLTDGRSSLAPGRNGKTWGGEGGGRGRSLLSSFKYSALFFSLPFVGWDNLCLIGWSCSLLNLAAWLSCLKSLRSSSDRIPVIVSSPLQALTSWPLWWCGLPGSELCWPDQSWTWL